MDVFREGEQRWMILDTVHRSLVLSWNEPIVLKRKKSKGEELFRMSVDKKSGTGREPNGNIVYTGGNPSNEEEDRKTGVWNLEVRRTVI